jgi:hypothetical protein
MVCLVVLLNVVLANLLFWSRGQSTMATPAKAAAVEASAAKTAPAETAAIASSEGVVCRTTETTTKGAGRRV